MKMTPEACLALANQTIFGDQFSKAKPIWDTNPDLRIYWTDEMIFKFSSDVESLKKEYKYFQEMLYADETVPGPYAFVTSESWSLLVFEVLGSRDDK